MIPAAALYLFIPMDSSTGASPWEWGWGAIGSLATGLAAIVTAITAVFIYFQTRETAKAATAGQHSAAAANDALALTRAQQQQTLFMAAEAVKNRIDASMPKVRVLKDDSIIWDPRHPGDYLDSPCSPIGSGREFNLPADGNQQILIKVSITIRNEGPGLAHLRFNHPITNGDEVLNEAHLAEGESLDEYTYSVQHSINEWAQIYEERRQGGEAQRFWFEVTNVHSMDTGAIDRTRVSFGGTLLEPVPGKNSVWRLLITPGTSPDYPTVGVEPTHRTYYLSLRENRLLPDYSLEPADASPQIL